MTKNNIKKYQNRCALLVILLTASMTMNVASLVRREKQSRETNKKIENATREYIKLLHANQELGADYDNTARAYARTMGWPRYYPERMDEIEIIGELSTRAANNSRQVTIVRDSITYMNKVYATAQSEIRLLKGTQSSKRK